MTQDQPPGSPGTTTIVVIGVSGTGKSTVAGHMVERLGWRLADGDDFHTATHVEQMRAGVPLDDEDRAPWLASIADWIGERESAGEDAVVTCSALRRAYRDVIRRDHPSVWFAHILSSPAVLRERVGARRGHYMAPSLLASQLETLEALATDEPGATVDGDAPPEVVAAAVISALMAARDAPIARKSADS